MTDFSINNEFIAGKAKFMQKLTDEGLEQFVMKYMLKI